VIYLGLVLRDIKLEGTPARTLRVMAVAYYTPDKAQMGIEGFSIQWVLELLS